MVVAYPISRLRIVILFQYFGELCVFARLYKLKIVLLPLVTKTLFLYDQRSSGKLRLEFSSLSHLGSVPFEGSGQTKDIRKGNVKMRAGVFSHHATLKVQRSRQS